MYQALRNVRRLAADHNLAAFRCCHRELLVLVAGGVVALEQTSEGQQGQQGQQTSIRSAAAAAAAGAAGAAAASAPCTGPRSGPGRGRRPEGGVRWSTRDRSSRSSKRSTGSRRSSRGSSAPSRSRPSRCRRPLSAAKMPRPTASVSSLHWHSLPEEYSSIRVSSRDYLRNAQQREGSL